MIARSPKWLVALAGVASLAGCKSAPPASPRPESKASAKPAPAPGPAAAETPSPSSSPAATLPALGASEPMPVPPETERVIEQYVTGGLDGELAARALEAQIAAPTTATVQTKPGWALSRRRSLSLAVLHAPRPLRDEVARIHDSEALDLDHQAAAALEADKLGDALALADRYPTLPFAEAVRARADELRASGPHDVLDVSTLAAVLPAGSPLAFSGITVRADGQEGLVANDGDGNRVWEYRLPPCPAGDFHLLRVLGTVRERIVALVLPHAGDPAVCVGIDATTGNERFHVEVFPLARDAAGRLEPLDSALGMVEVVLASPGKVAVVDVRRGELAWRREGLGTGRLSSVGAERVVLASARGEGSPLELELATGRRAGTTIVHPKPGSIEIK